MIFNCDYFKAYFLKNKNLDKANKKNYYEKNLIDLNSTIKS